MFLLLAFEVRDSFAATPPVAIGSPDQLSVAACCGMQLLSRSMEPLKSSELLPALC